jgi:hypothetical protein
MSHKKLNQKGFSAVEAILILVIVALVGGTGYFVYHSNRSANATLNSAIKDNSSASNASIGGKGGAQAAGAAGDTHQAKTEVYLIPEWKLAADVPAPQGCQSASSCLYDYTIATDSQPVAAKFTSQDLISLDKDNCSADNAPGGMIARALGTDPFYLSDGTQSDKTVAQTLVQGSNKPYKKIGDYYYWYVHAQAACSDSGKAQSLQNAAAAFVQSVIVNLKPSQ